LLQGRSEEDEELLGVRVRDNDVLLFERMKLVNRLDTEAADEARGLFPLGDNKEDEDEDKGCSCGRAGSSG
jgi:hypothetical protein